MRAIDHLTKQRSRGLSMRCVALAVLLVLGEVCRRIDEGDRQVHGFELRVCVL